MTEGSDHDWLSGLARAAQPALGQEAPAFAHLYDVSRAEPLTPRRVAGLVGALAPPPGAALYRLPIPEVAATDNALAIRRALVRLHEIVPGFILDIYRTGLRCATAVENTGGKPHPLWLALSSPALGNYLAVAGATATGEGVLVGAPWPESARVPMAMRRSWVRVAVHLAAGLRLRRALAPEEAVLDPDGRVLHAQGDARSAPAREALARAARRREQARGHVRREDPMAAVDLWRGLVSGRWSLVDRFERDGRRFVVARKNPPGHRDPRALTGRERDVAASIARGQTVQLTAYELGLSPSTVSTHLGRALRKLGLQSRAELSALGVALSTDGPPSSSAG